MLEKKDGYDRQFRFFVNNFSSLTACRKTRKKVLFKGKIFRYNLI